MQQPTQPQPTKNEREQWWLYCYAFVSMEKATRCCQLLQANCTNNCDPLFEPLILATHAYYARPFKESSGVGRLRKDVIPSGQVGIHGCLIHFRDCVLCHTDAKYFPQAKRPMHDIVYSCHGPVSLLSTSNPLPHINAYRDFEAHFKIMAEIFQRRIREFEEVYRHCLPQIDGDYQMSLDESLDLFLPHTLPTQEIIRYS